MVVSSLTSSKKNTQIEHIYDPTADICKSKMNSVMYIQHNGTTD